jgi:hypothetical protein
MPLILSIASSLNSATLMLPLPTSHLDTTRHISTNSLFHFRSSYTRFKNILLNFKPLLLPLRALDILPTPYPPHVSHPAKSPKIVTSISLLLPYPSFFAAGGGGGGGGGLALPLTYFQAKNNPRILTSANVIINIHFAA